MPTLRQSVETYLKLDRSNTTNTIYRHLLFRLMAAIGPERDIRLVTFADLVDYTAHLRAQVMQSTYCTYVRIIKTFFTWCVAVGYLELSPAAPLAAKAPPRDPTKQCAVPDDILLAMLEDAHHPRDRAIVLFIADTGCRISAAASLQLSRLDLNTWQAVIREKGNRFVPVYFGEDTAQALEDWLRVRPQVAHDFVWVALKGRDSGQPFKVRAMTSIIRRLSRQAGKEYGPHALRHWVGEAWHDENVAPVDIQYKLNHARLETTVSKYFPRQSHRVGNLSRQLSVLKLLSKRLKEAEKPSNVLYLDDCG